MKRLIALFAGFALLASSQAFAAGYEKSIPWGGRSAGMGGIATPYISGSQALFFNPAGLVSDRVGHDVSFNISPVWSQFKGPINNGNDQASSEKKMLTPFGLMYGATLNEKLGFGIGGYVSGGSYANYENVEYSGVASSPTVKSDLQVTELAAGAGYRITSDLKVGAAVRLVSAKADFQFINRAGATTIYNPQVKDLKDDNNLAFKLGAQYKLGEKTSLGLTYRSQVRFEAEGKFGGNVITNSATLPIDETDAKAHTIFPQQIALGVMHQYNENWRSAAELVWTEYSKVDKVQVEGTMTRSGGTAIAGGADPVIQQRWSDQWNLRLGGEYVGYSYPIRFGYVYTTTVTAPEWARAAFLPPGPAHTLTLGTGKAIGESFQIDGGLEYTTGKADVGSGNSVDIRPGKYEVTAYGAHVGVSYLF